MKRKYGGPGKCIVYGCSEPRNGRFCPKHLARHNTYGTAEPRCGAEGCNILVFKQGWCQGHHSVWMRFGDPLACNQFDIAPARRLIDIRGGIGACLGSQGIYKDQPQHERLVKVYERAIARGYVNTAVADIMAVEVLGTHPAFIWGDDWWVDPVRFDYSIGQAVAS